MKLINFKNKVNSYKGYGVVYSDDETPPIMDSSLYQEWSDERSDFFENAEIETIEQFLTWTVKHDPNYWHDLKNWAKEDEVSSRRYLLGTSFSQVELRSPIVKPTSIRDFYAFEQHVKTANENRGREVPKQWYEIPVFYFTNHTAIFGPGDVIPYPVGSEKLDYELEVAAVIGKEGKDIKLEEAEDYIFGYMIYNDWSARDIQAQEMAVGLGPAKGKDFAQSFGPYLVTPDELKDRHTGRPGVYDLEMIARVNGKETSRGNWKDIHWSFGEMLARASAGVTLYPGDVIGSGTVGTGCLLEITKGQGPYLQSGDVVELEIERLGVLRNTVGEKRV
jgi:2-keto-4-pentenoate hydratase/2-oxohepta-3-ene-1,7-dioic acid hydratase in catechol pathway